MNEEKFKNYLSRTPSQRGKVPDERKINSLVEVLKTDIPNKLNDFDGTSNNSSLFKVENINDLKQIKKRLNKGGDLYTWDQNNYGKGGCSAALYQYIKFLDEESSPEINKILQQEALGVKIKNIILYGSPGVGKTHNTQKLISLIESGKSEKEIFEIIKNNEPNYGIDIDNIKDRVKFITFHQSFGYEDFIEGFRPNEEGNIELEDGVFKLICQQAQKNLVDSQKPSEEISKEIKFKKILDTFIEEVESVLENDGVYPLTENIYIFNVEEDAFRYKGDNWTIHSSGLRMRFDILEKLYTAHAQSRQEVKNIDGIGGLAKQHATYFWKLLEKLYTFENKQNIQVDEVKKIERKNYYLVIDEINRGNISKIFGELITLIEEDKRDTLEVTLPYSKKPFKIPSNLYIIGTMNSTDKSIALIDIALRRRFTFLKMEPNLDLVDNVKAKNIMKQLNEKITETLGVDYVLGHSYFMKIENDDDLDFVLEYKIKPLLEEYFYGDSEGLKQILEMIDE